MRLVRGQPPSRWVARFVIGLAILNVIAGWAGDLLLAAIVEDDPALLIALSPRDRNLAAAAGIGLDPLPYYLIGFVRLVFFDPASYLLGFWYGDRALAWIKRRSRTYGPLVDDATGGFRKYSAPLILLFPNNIICMMAGASGVGVATFIALNASGTAARLVILRTFGNVFSSQITGVVGWIDDNKIPILIISAVFVGWSIFGEFRGNDSEMQTLIDLEKEPEESSDET